MSGNEQKLQNENQVSTRTQGLWALLFALCGMVSIFADNPVYAITSIVWAMIWNNGCEKRGNKYWPAIFEGQRYLVHSILMISVMALLVGIAFHLYKFIAGGLFGLSAMMSISSLDLIFYDTKEKYVENFQLIEQMKKENVKISWSVLFQWQNTNFLMLIVVFITLIFHFLMFIVIFIAEYKKLVLQIDEWITPLIR